VTTVEVLLIIFAIGFPLLVGSWPAIGVSMLLVHLQRRINLEAREVRP